MINNGMREETHRISDEVADETVNPRRDARLHVIREAALPAAEVVFEVAVGDLADDLLAQPARVVDVRGHPPVQRPLQMRDHLLLQTSHQRLPVDRGRRGADDNAGRGFPAAAVAVVARRGGRVVDLAALAWSVRFMVMMMVMMMVVMIMMPVSVGKAVGKAAGKARDAVDGWSCDSA